MIFMHGLNQEKQHVSVDAEETRRLHEFFESRLTLLEAHPAHRLTRVGWQTLRARRA